MLPVSAIIGVQAHRVVDGGCKYGLTYPCGGSLVTVDLTKEEYQWVCFDVLELPESPAAGTYTDRALSEPLPRVEQP